MNKPSINTASPKKTSKAKWFIGAGVLGIAFLALQNDNEPEQDFEAMGAQALEHFDNRRFSQAYELAKIAAPNGSADGQHVMGLLHINDRYIGQRDITISAQWFEKAAKQEHDMAMVGLDYIFKNHADEADIDLCDLTDWLKKVDVHSKPLSLGKEAAFNLLVRIDLQNPNLKCP